MVDMRNIPARKPVQKHHKYFSRFPVTCACLNARKGHMACKTSDLKWFRTMLLGKAYSAIEALTREVTDVLLEHCVQSLQKVRAR